VGNVHGIIVAPDFTEHLNINRIKEIHEAVSVPLVLHGGSGLPESDFTDGIKVGISIIHISTELRVAFRQGLEKALHDMPDESAPYKYLIHAQNAMQEAVEKKIKIV